MRDYFLVDEVTGSRTPIAKLATSEIYCLLNDGFEIVHDTYDDNIPSVTDRLRLELEIRAMGLGEVE